jgi:hypothetical protein
MCVDALAISLIDTNAPFHKRIWDNISLFFFKATFSRRHHASAECLIATLQALYFKLLKVL